MKVLGDVLLVLGAAIAVVWLLIASASTMANRSDTGTRCVFYMPAIIGDV